MKLKLLKNKRLPGNVIAMGIFFMLGVLRLRVDIDDFVEWRSFRELGQAIKTERSL